MLHHSCFLDKELQEQDEQSMGTTKSAVSRLEAADKHSPSIATLKKYAKAVGCEIEIRPLPVYN
jgi:transcriptional regulator with XRE-family HTH domain